MKIAFCFYGGVHYLDGFMVQNMVRCLVTPFQKQRDSQSFFFLHTYLDNDTLSHIQTMRQFFPFMVVSLYDMKMLSLDDDVNDFSLNRVKRIWKSSSYTFDLVVYVRLNLLFARPLSENDISHLFANNNHIFMTDYPSKELQSCVVIGNSHTMSVYADKIYYHGDQYTEWLGSEHNLYTASVTIAFVRILSDGFVHSDDYQICPYLKDMIASSTTKIRLVKRKHSVKNEFEKSKQKNKHEESGRIS